MVISALANTYINYVTTLEEYNVQRYEGASTIYGPHTLSAFIQEFNKLAAALAKVCVCACVCACVCVCTVVVTAVCHYIYVQYVVFLQGVPVSPGPSPPNYLDEQISLVTPVVLDGVPFLKDFGDIKSNAHSRYRRGVSVTKCS